MHVKRSLLGRCLLAIGNDEKRLCGLLKGVSAQMLSIHYRVVVTENGHGVFDIRLRS